MGKRKLFVVLGDKNCKTAGDQENELKENRKEKIYEGEKVEHFLDLGS